MTRFVMRRTDLIRRVGIRVLLVPVLLSGCTTMRPAGGIRTAHSAADENAQLAQRLRDHISLLAHDALEGRGTGSDGIDLAAGYIAGQFAAAGLEPGGPDGTYFQRFEIDRGFEFTKETSLHIVDDGPEPKLREDYIPFGFSTSGSFEGDVVFVGYGITAADRSHDDYAGLDVKGRVVLMLRREPTSWNPDGGYTEHARFDHKVPLAKAHGAAAVLIVNQDPGPDGIDGLMRFRPARTDYGIPALHISRALADRMLAAGGLASITALQRKADKGEHVSAPLKGVRVEGTVAYEKKTIVARNVIGVLPGTGDRADEYIVIGAHYDHLGRRRGEIFNGADDNASGTSGVIELAWRLAAKRHRERSVLFITFAGEEMGLLGSEHFVAHPTVPPASIKAMINLDMIGRLTPDQEANMLAIQGLGTGSSFADIVERETARAGLKYLPDPSALGPSDHASFYKAGIPSLFFFTGVHEDYHAPSDDVERINTAGEARIVRLVGRIAEDLVNAEESPVYAEVPQEAKIFRGMTWGRPGGVVLGIVPDVQDASDAPGVRVTAIVPGRGAARAGMKSGDRILRIDGVTIRGLRDIRKALKGRKPGDRISVEVLRAGEKRTLSVELTARGG